MTADRDPPYPADTRARGWRFELDYERIDQSDTWSFAAEVPMAQHALLMMWLVAWKETPCGSLPSDEPTIRVKCRIPPTVWAKVRDVLMRGWIAANDGRLYHSTITARVLEMLKAKEAERQRKANYRARMDAERLVASASVPRDNQGTDGGRTPDSGGSDDTGTGTGTNSLSNPSGQKDRPARKRAAAAQRVGVDDMVAEGVDRQHATDWLVARKAKDLPLTPTAWQQTKDEAVKAGISVADAIKTAAGNGWAGFRATWLDQTDAAGRTPTPTKQSALEARNAAVVAAVLERMNTDDPH